jgi:hypothetical protein
LIVQCISFGSAWWLRPGTDRRTGAVIRVRSAFLNTTGFARGKNVARHYFAPGFVRVNAAMNPPFSTPTELLDGKFATNGIERYKESNRLLLKARVGNSVATDAFLVCLRSGSEGKIDIKSSWRRGPVRVISSSFHRVSGAQELLLLIGPGGIVTTELGEWEVECNSKKAILVLK